MRRRADQMCIKNLREGARFAHGCETSSRVVVDARLPLVEVIDGGDGNQGGAEKVGGGRLWLKNIPKNSGECEIGRRVTFL